MSAHTSKLSIGIIGIGRWGRNLVREFDGLANIVAVSSKGGEENRKWLSATYPAIAYVRDHDEILSNPSIQAVVIATPIATHYEVAKAALEAGKDVFLEKPMTDDPKRAEALMALAKKKRQVLFVGHVFLFHPVLEKIKELTAGDPVRYAHFSWNKYGSFHEDIAWNLACHDLAVAIALFGIPEKLEKCGEWGGVSAGDLLSLHAGFSGNRRCTIDINRISNQKRKAVTLVTAAGTVLLWENDVLHVLDKETGAFRLAYAPQESALQRECILFLKAVVDRKNPPEHAAIPFETVKALSAL